MSKHEFELPHDLYVSHHEQAELYCDALKEITGDQIDFKFAFRPGTIRVAVFYDKNQTSKEQLDEYIKDFEGE